MIPKPHVTVIAIKELDSGTSTGTVYTHAAIPVSSWIDLLVKAEVKLLVRPTIARSSSDRCSDAGRIVLEAERCAASTLKFIILVGIVFPILVAIAIRASLNSDEITAAA